MNSCVRLSIARIAVLAMLATLLSPSWAMGWLIHHEHDDHVQLDGRLAALDHEHDGEHDRDDSHDFIGHLLSHLPAGLVAEVQFAVPHRAPAIIGAAEVHLPLAARPPPYPPPRHSFPL